MGTITESEVEGAALAWLQAIGWQIAHGLEIAPDMPAAVRRDYGELVLKRWLRDALGRLNPHVPAEALEHAFRRMTCPQRATIGPWNRWAN